MRAPMYMSIGTTRFGKGAGENTLVGIVPAITVACRPPYVAGEYTSLWIRGRPPNPRDKADCERAAGMSLLAVPQS